MKINPLPPVDRLRALIDYSPETGEMLWKRRPQSDFADRRYPAERLAKVWNSKHVGKPALNSRMANGYLHGTVDGAYVLAHRVAWKLMTGEDPNFIDHLNGRRADNRFENLRSVSAFTNMRNRKLSQNNTSGVIGVHWEQRSGLWVVQTEIEGVVRYVGRYKTVLEAAKARAEAVDGLGFSERHGLPA